MIERDKSTYLEYASIVFVSLCFFYFLNSLYTSYSHSSFYQQKELKNFDVYTTILARYNAEIVDFQIVDGQVEAYVKKNSFQAELFQEQEPYLLESFNSHYLITFKIVKKIEKKTIAEKKPESKGFSSLNDLAIENFCYFDKKHWSISINGVIYTYKNSKRNGIDIVLVSADEVQILFGENKMSFQI